MPTLKMTETVKKINGVQIAITDQRDGVQRTEWLYIGSSENAVGTIHTARWSNRVIATTPNGVVMTEEVSNCMTKNQLFTKLRRWLVDQHA